MNYKVTVQINGTDVLAGTLYQNVRRGVETATFSYAESYLENPSAFALAPDMPLGAGTFHSAGLTEFRALEDCMPDRWGRNLMLRAERNSAKEESRAVRTLFEADMLTGVSDKMRQGALRIWAEDDTSFQHPLASQERGVPREIDIPSLLNAADKATMDLDADIRDLLEAGSSLGGARPKASIQDEQGFLCIAKFPKVDEDQLVDSAAWEKTMLDIMAECGISVPESRLIRVAGRSVLLMRRFDRRGSHDQKDVQALRIPYISGLTAVQGKDGQHYSYLELVDFLETEGARSQEDIQELWLRALFSCVVGNTDNHLRNYGFLHVWNGWILSPVFDVNPTPGDHPKLLSTGLDFDDRSADPALALSVCEYYRLTEKQAKAKARKMVSVLGKWQAFARSNGISEASLAYMESNFESGLARLRNLV